MNFWNSTQLPTCRAANSANSMRHGSVPSVGGVHKPYGRSASNIRRPLKKSGRFPTRSMQQRAAETSQMINQFPVSSGQQHRSSELVPVFSNQDPRLGFAPANNSKQPLAMFVPPPKKYNQNQLKTAAPVASGMGMTLLQKMGWRPGEGLGKNKDGCLEPIKLDVKFDKKGFVSQKEAKSLRFQSYPRPKKQGGGVPPNGMGIMSALTSGGGVIFSGKHPVTALIELCIKRQWQPPIFDIVFESGPVHNKNYTFKVSVNNKEYQPQSSCGNKKQAKAMAAQLCLEQLGLVVKMASANLSSTNP